MNFAQDFASNLHRRSNLHLLDFVGPYSQCYRPLQVTAGSAEETPVMQALVARHPSFKNYPPGHGFYVAKIDLDGAARLY